MACSAHTKGRRHGDGRRPVKFGAFEQVAQQAWSEIPDGYLEGIDGLTIREESRAHPDQPAVFTLGECITESYPSTWEGPETLRSTVVLYFGSFRALADQDPKFDWEAEVWETLTHELRHHLESLAGRDDLVGVDYVMDQDMRRGAGHPFDPFYYQQGESVGKGVFRAEDLVFVESAWTGDAPPESVEFAFGGWTIEVAVPSPTSGPDADIHYLVLVGFEDIAGRPVGDLIERVDRTEVVVVHNRTLLSRLRDVASASRMRVLESDVVARVLPQAN